MNYTTNLVRDGHIRPDDECEEDRSDFHEGAVRRVDSALLEIKFQAEQALKLMDKLPRDITLTQLADNWDLELCGSTLMNNVAIFEDLKNYKTRVMELKEAKD